ncbi:MAG: GAF domain-containing protein [Chloroflexi bacterium]|jgi:GAF domain-containing protein|nr:GAF domain-containing protein [Chloroflexota bacterium]
MDQIIGRDAATTESTERLYKSWRERFVLPLLLGSLIFGAIGLLPTIIASESVLVDGLFIATYALIAVSAIFNFPYSARISAFLLGAYVLGMAELISLGILGDSLFFFLALVVFSTMLHSPRAGVVSIVTVMITFAVMGTLIQSGRFETLNPNAAPSRAEDWISAGVALIMFGVVIIIGFRQLENEFSQAQSRITQTMDALRGERNTLESRVEERTQQLRRINEVERAVAAVLDLNEILPLAARYIQNEFGFYCTTVYILDSSGQWVELTEAVGEAGRLMKDKKHRVNVNGKALVAQVIRSKTGLIMEDNERIVQEYPLFPYTRSLVIVPLVAGDTILGALEMHSSRDAEFHPQDLDAFQNMANGISVSIENARLFQEARQSISEMQATQRQYLETSWSALASERDLQYALGDAEQSGGNSFEAPLSLRNQVLGEIIATGAKEWTPEQKNLVESIAAQAALALENARLVEDSRFTASQEKLTNEIIAKIWAAPNMDAILQTVARELGRNMEASEVEIEVSMEGAGDE